MKLELLKKLIEFLKKIGLLKMDVKASTYKSSKDEGYQPPDPLDN